MPELKTADICAESFEVFFFFPHIIQKEVKVKCTNVQTLITSLNSLSLAATDLGFVFEQDLQDVVVGLL